MDISSIALFAWPALAYDGNSLHFPRLAIALVAIYLAYRYFVSYHRKAGYISAYTHFEKGIAPWAGKYAAVIFVVYSCVRIGVILYLLSGALALIVDTRFQYTVILISAVVGGYTYLGGIRAVVVTDVVQSILMLLGMAFMVGYCTLENPCQWW